MQNEGLTQDVQRLTELTNNKDLEISELNRLHQNSLAIKQTELDECEENEDLFNERGIEFNRLRA